MSRKAEAVWKPIINHDGGRFYSVESETKRGHFYRVDRVDAEVAACNCASFHFQNRRQCKHVAAVQEYVKSQQGQPTGRNSTVGTGHNKPTHTEATLPTKEQSELLAKLAESAGRFSNLAPKARDIGCSTLAKDLESIAKQLGAAVDLQRRVLSSDVQTRTAALAEAELPFRVL